MRRLELVQYSSPDRSALQRLRLRIFIQQQPASGAAGIPISTLSKVLGAASIFGSSAYLMLLRSRHSLNWAGSAAGMLVVTSPALWLTLGHESSFSLLLVLAAYFHFYRGSTWPRRFSRRWPS